MPKKEYWLPFLFIFRNHRRSSTIETILFVEMMYSLFSWMITNCLKICIESSMDLVISEILALGWRAILLQISVMQGMILSHLMNWRSAISCQLIKLRMALRVVSICLKLKMLEERCFSISIDMICIHFLFWVCKMSFFEFAADSWVSDFWIICCLIFLNLSFTDSSFSLCNSSEMSPGVDLSLIMENYWSSVSVRLVSSSQMRLCSLDSMWSVGERKVVSQIRHPKRSNGVDSRWERRESELARS